MENLEAALLAGEEAEARCREPAQMGAVGKDDRDPAAPDAPKTHAADAAEVHADAGEAEDAASPVSTSDAGCGAIVAEQGIRPWSHLEGARVGEAPIQEEAEVPGPAEGERREGGGHDVGLLPLGQGGVEPEPLELEHAGTEDPLVLAFDDVEGELEVGRGGLGAALGEPDRPLD